jgi:hypothetical protein
MDIAAFLSREEMRREGRTMNLLKVRRANRKWKESETVEGRSMTWARVLLSAILFAFVIGTAGVEAQEPAGPATAPKAAAPVGTIKSISGNSLVLTSDAGDEVHVEVRDSTKIVRIAPGQKDLKDAQTIALTDLQAGDRILVRGKATDDSKAFAATSIMAMKKGDIAEKQSREREEWQKSGVGGLVNSVDAAGGVISVTVPSLREKKTVAVHISSRTILRRYAPGSVKFDDAKPAPLEQIRPGDQLRARGEKSADGSELSAVEAVSGSFRNVSGVIGSMDTAQGTIAVHDLGTKKTVTVKITPDSQLRKLTAAIAQRIALRLNGSGAAANGEEAPEGSPAAATAPIAKAPAPGTGQATAAGGEGRGREGRGRGLGAGAGGAGSAMDLQQIISRMPAATISDLQKGDAVMLVGTEGSSSEVTVITLLAGVEPILQGSPNGASSILSPWSLSGAPGVEAGTP